MNYRSGRGEGRGRGGEGEGEGQHRFQTTVCMSSWRGIVRSRQAKRNLNIYIYIYIRWIYIYIYIRWIYIYIYISVESIYIYIDIRWIYIYILYPLNRVCVCVHTLGLLRLHLPPWPGWLHTIFEGGFIGIQRIYIHTYIHIYIKGKRKRVLLQTRRWGEEGGGLYQSITDSSCRYTVQQMTIWHDVHMMQILYMT